MGTRINTNTLAMNAARYGQMNDTKVASSIEKLSSGLRINRAADDAAGLVISESLRSQVSGLDQAIRNSNEAANMIKTAEGAMSEVHDLLRSVRTLAVHASNTGANDAGAIAADQAQIANAIKSLDRISANTSFGSLKLLDGSASTKVTTNAASKIGNLAATGGVAAGDYRLEVTTAGVKGSMGKSEARTAAITGGTITAAAASGTMTISDGTTSIAVSLTTTGSSTSATIATALNANTAFAAKYTAADDGTGKLKITVNGDVQASQVGNFTAVTDSAALAGTTGIATGTAVAATGTATAGATAAQLKFGRVTGTGTGTLSTSSPLGAGSTLTFSDAGSTLGVSDTVVVDVAGATSLQEVADKVNKDATASKYVEAKINTSGQLEFNSKAATTAAGAAQFTVASSSGLNAKIGLASASVVGTAQTATADKQIMADVQYSFQAQGPDGSYGAAKTFTIAKGTTLSTAFDNFKKFAEASGLEASMSLTSDGGVKITNNDVGTNRGVQVKVGSGLTDVLKVDQIATGSGTASSGFTSGVQGVNLGLKVNGSDVAASDINGSKVSVSAASGALLKGANGLSLQVMDYTTTGTKGTVSVGGGALKFQLGANAGEQSEVQLDSTDSNTLGKGAVAGKTVKDIDVSTFEGAQQALSIIDKAISDVSGQRAKLGAFQSQVLESNARSLSVAKENLTASESTIRDTDMAAEMVQFTKNNILSQASQAMLSQANNSSQGILQLLRG